MHREQVGCADGTAGLPEQQEVDDPKERPLAVPQQCVGLAPSSYPACYSHWMGDEAARARARRRWPVLLSSLRNQPSDDLSSSTTLEERIAMMRPLAEAAWRVAGLPLPRYRRSRIPVRLLVRRGGEETETPLPRRR